MFTTQVVDIIILEIDFALLSDPRVCCFGTVTERYFDFLIVSYSFCTTVTNRSGSEWPLSEYDFLYLCYIIFIERLHLELE